MTHSRPRAAARPVRPATALAALVVAMSTLAGCASTPTAVDASASGDAAASASTLSGTLTIAAAASLKTAFDRLAADFEAQNPGVDVLPISYDGSSTLATQIIEGAAVDVFASADQKNMAKVTDASLATDPEPFATNVLTLVVPSGNPGGVTGLADLANPDLDVVLCAAEVPCGFTACELRCRWIRLLLRPVQPFRPFRRVSCRAGRADGAQPVPCPSATAA